MNKPAVNKQKQDQHPYDTTSFPIGQWFILLRWLACAVSLALIVATVKVLNYLDGETFLPLLALTALTGITNLVYTYMQKHRCCTRYFNELQITVDLLILTVLLIFSGGIENPLSFTYLFHVIISGILLDKTRCYQVVGLCFILYGTMTLGELYGILPHYTLHIFPHPHGEGGHHHIHASHDPVYAWSMMIIYLFIMILTAHFTTTIMERLRHQEKRAREERQRLERVLEATGAGLLILNNKLQPIWHNKPVKKWLAPAYRHHGDMTKTFSNWLQTMKQPHRETLTTGNVQVVERQRLDEKGKNQFFQVTLAPLTDENNRVYQVVELIQDISEKKLLEEEMIHSARLVMLGTMAAGIAHEVGNPLASLATRLHLMSENRDPAFLTKSIGLLRREIHRIERIVYDISRFGRPTENLWKVCQVNQIINESFEIIKYHKTAKSSTIRFQPAKNLPPTLVAHDQLKQVFINLALNALGSMPRRGGQLTVNSRFEKDYLLVEFIDNGAGIKADDLEKIFQPFFTRKESGSGLGLFIVNQIILAHGGKIDVESHAGKGSKFTVYLPQRNPSQGKINPREIK